MRIFRSLTFAVCNRPSLFALLAAPLACGLLWPISPAQAQCVTNSQTITTVLFASGNGCIINSGTSIVTVSGFASTARAIYLNGSGSIANSGAAIATASGDGSEAFAIVGGGSITNSGTASATASGVASTALAISLNGSGGITNSGTASATASGVASTAWAMFLNGNGSITNSGTASATASGAVSTAVAVFLNGSGSIANSGTASANTNAPGGVAFAIFLGGSGSITNSGTASATASGLGSVSDAIYLNGGGSTLTLLPGSFIVGNIFLTGTNNAVAMNVANQNLTFNSLAGASVTGNVPFAVVGNRIVSLDPTSFAMQGRALNDFTREVSSSIPQITGGAPAGGAPLAFAAPDASARIEDVFASIPGLAAYSGEAMVFKNPTVIYSDGSAVWARGFAGNRVQPGDGTLLPGKSQFYGGMIGADMRVWPELRIGAFLGMGNSRFWVDQPFTVAGANFGNGSSDLAFGGVYTQYDAGATFLRAALQGGGSRNSTTRNINNNLVAGGLEVANAGFNGWYVSPEATVGHRLALGQLADAAYTLTPSLRLRYLYGSYEGYTETGTTTAPLTMGSRTVGTLEERGEFKLTRTVTFTPQSQLSMSAYGGVLGTQRADDSLLNAAFLSQAIPFASPGAASVWGGFGGGGLEWRTANVTLFSAAEYLALSDNSNIISGRAGLRIGF